MPHKPNPLSVRRLTLPAKISSKAAFEATACVPQLQTPSARAAHLLEQLPQRNLYSLNAELASHSRNANPRATWSLFRLMHCASLNLTAYSFTPVISACSTLPVPDPGKQVHGLMIKTGTDVEIITKTALLDMYSKYGYLGDSVKVFEEMEYRDVVTWNALLSSFLRRDLAKEALGLFGAMRREGVKFSEFTLCSMLKACTICKTFQSGKQVHGVVVVMGRDLVVLGTSLIVFYSSVGKISEALKVFYTLRCRKDDMIYNSLIAGCVKNRKYREAFSLISSTGPNAVALTTAIAACSDNSDLWIGMQIHGVATRLGFILDTRLCNALLEMYAKCGKILNAKSLFNSICHKSVVSWTSMIDAYGRHGYGCEALELFKKMGEEGSRIFPNSATFLAILSACGHSGLVEEGKELFNLAREKYGLDPGQEHYSCIMDILGRAGRIEDVWCVYHDMVKNGTRPTTAIWATLLNACSLNRDVSRGEFAATRLLELEPNNPGNHVLLSNFYASIGRWDSVNSLRSNMKEKGLGKEPGSSWVIAEHCHESNASL